MPKRNGGKRRNGSAKYQREINKRNRKGSAISNFVRGKISAAEYFKKVK